jgi:hypothetical protein
MGPNAIGIVSAVATVIGATATALGVWFLVGQLRSARKQLTVTAFEHLYSRMQGIHEQFLHQPALRRYFYDGKPIEDAGESEREEVVILAEMLADFFQQVHLQLDLMPRKAAQGWRAYIEDIIRRSPALRDFLRAHGAWYTGGQFEVAATEDSSGEDARMVVG